MVKVVKDSAISCSLLCSGRAPSALGTLQWRVPVGRLGLHFALSARPDHVCSSSFRRCSGGSDITFLPARIIRSKT
jgi:hypothetical protein